MATTPKEKVTLLHHSRPGEYPRKQTGHLRRTITYEVDEVTQTARVGTNLLYGKFLELGTKRMKPRPFLRKTLMSERVVLARLLAGGVA
jgi:HK97 gp10 family phage protein